MTDPVCIEVPEGTHERRADKVLADYFEDISRTKLQLVFSNGHVSVNGETVQKRFPVSEGDLIEILLPEQEVPEEIMPVDLGLEVLYEDEDLIAINKQPGVVTHPGAGTGNDTLVHGLMYQTGGALAPAGGAVRPGVVHRLDKDTSGVILFAKSDKAYLRLVKMFSEREMEKSYMAIVCGFPRLASGVIDEPIGRNQSNRLKMQVTPKGRPSKTTWVLSHPLEGNLALLKCDLHSGRTHQIRVHLEHIGHPIFGDTLYGNPNTEGPLSAPRQMLHACRLAFSHPVTGEAIEIQASLPDDMAQFVQPVEIV